MHRKRHLTLPTHETSVLLERTFWDTVDRLATKKNQSWQDWVKEILKDKPEDIGRATWIRTQSHNSLWQEAKDKAEKAIEEQKEWEKTIDKKRDYIQSIEQHLKQKRDECLYFRGMYESLKENQKPKTKKSAEKPSENPLLQRPVDELEMTARSQNGLRADDIETIGDLIKISERQLLNIPNLGKGCLTEIKDALATRNLKLKDG